MDEKNGRILLVEDDDGIAAPLSAALRGASYQVERVSTGREALESAGPDVLALVLDLGLPDMDGVDVCRAFNEAYPNTPVLMLTARTSEADIVVGLDAGADDYVTKPFRLAELLARLRALIRRAGTGDVVEASEVSAQDVRIDVAARRAYKGDEELELTPKEFDLLAMLVREAGTVVSREDIMKEVWDTNWFGSTKTVDMHVSWLRRKLGDDATHPQYISTVRGVGLRFEREHHA